MKALLPFVIAAAAMTSSTICLSAGTYTWKDTSGTTTTATWIDPHWNNGSSDDHAWSDANSAVFTSSDATVRTISITSSINATDIQVNSGSWLFSTVGGSFAASTGGLSVASGATLSLGDSAATAVKPTNMTGDITVNGTLNVYGNAGDSFSTNTNIIINSGGIVNVAGDYNSLRYAKSYTIDGGELKLTGTSSSNLRGLLTMKNGAILSGNDGNYGTWKVYNIAVSGTTASTISAASLCLGDGVTIASKAYSVFDVADVTGNSDDDLIVTSYLRTDHNGGLLKRGAGTMYLNSTASNNSETHDWLIENGTLRTGSSDGRMYLGAAAGTRTITVGATDGTTAARLEINATNQFGGGTLVLANAPKLVINGGSVISTASFNAIGNVQLNNGATLTSTAGTNGSYQAYEFLDGSTISVTGTGLSTISSTAPSNGGIHLNKNVTFDVADTVVGTGTDLIVSAKLINSSPDRAGAAGALIKNGAGTLELTAANTYTGDTTINAGTLKLSGAGSISNSSSVNLTTSGAKIEFASSTSIQSLNGAYGTVVTIGTGSTLTLSGPAGTHTGQITGAGNLVVATTGTVTLSSIVHTGSTSVNSGTLAVSNGNFVGTSGITVGGAGQTAALIANSAFIAAPITVKANGTLSGAFVSGGLITIKDGGILSPGNSPGTITANGGVKLESGATYLFEISTSGQDNIIGNLAFDSGAKLYIAAIGDISGRAGDIFKVASGTITGWNDVTIDNQTGYQIDNLGNGQFQIIPEPSTYALIGGLSALGIGIVTRRRKAK